jgi:hypothetical protein
MRISAMASNLSNEEGEMATNDELSILMVIFRKRHHSMSEYMSLIQKNPTPYVTRG